MQDRGLETKSFSVDLKLCLMHNGVKNVIARTWPGADEYASAVLLKRFFRNIAAGIPPAKALRLAKQLVHDEIDKHPSFWGGYQLEGTAF